MAVEECYGKKSGEAVRRRLRRRAEEKMKGSIIGETDGKEKRKKGFLSLSEGKHGILKN